MQTKTPDLDKVIADLDVQIDKKQAIVAGVLDEIVQLKMRRERMADTLKEISGQIANVSPVRKRRPVGPDDRSAIQGKAATVITEALRAAGDDGLSGAELSKKVVEAGLSSAAADKAKTRLRQSQSVTQRNGRWYLPVQSE